MRLEFHPGANQDILDAGARYRALRPSLGRDYRDELNAGFVAILQAPERWAVWRGTKRRYLLNRFPYAIVYRFIKPDTVRILVVRHHSQHPGYGMRRS